MTLLGKTIFITGASSGIGEATARLLARQGARLMLAARRTDRLQQLTDELTAQGGDVQFVACDVADPASVQAAVAAALAAFGHLDVLINNAGVTHLGMLEQLRYTEWMTMLDVNLKGALNTIHAVLPGMMAQRSGHIINMSSLAGRTVFPGGAVYSLTKFGLRALSEGMRQELTGPYNIRVTVLEPGTVRTEFLAQVGDEALRAKNAGFLEADVLEPEDIAEAMLYVLLQPDRVNVSEMKIEPTHK